MTGPSDLELCIRHIGIMLAAYVVLLVCLRNKLTMRRITAGGAAAGLIGVAAGAIYNYIPMCSLLLMLLSFYISMSLLYKLSTRDNFTLTLVSFGVAYALDYAASGIALVVLFLNKMAVSYRFSESIDAWIYITHFVTSFKGGLLVRSFVVFIQLGLLIILMKNKVIKNGLTGLAMVKETDMLFFLWVSVLSIRMLAIMSFYRRNLADAIWNVCSFLVIILTLTCCLWWRRKHESDYRADIQRTEIMLLETCLHSKNQLIRELNTDNERLSAIIHKDNKLIPSIVMAVRRTAEGCGDMSHTAVATETLNDIYTLRRDALKAYNAHTDRLPATGVTAADAVMLHMQRFAKERGVELIADIQDDWPQMLAEATERGEFVILLANLIHLAVMTVESDGNGMVTVNIGKTGGSRYIEVLDTGEPFTAEKLKKMAKRRTPECGARCAGDPDGMGLYRIIKHRNASLEAENLRDGKKYTKALRVIFDGIGRTDFSEREIREDAVMQEEEKRKPCRMRS